MGTLLGGTRYDAQDSAILGNAQAALGYIIPRVLHQGTCEGSSFPGYLARDPADGAPQVESNGIVAVTLQKMLLQTDGERILLFPAWPRGIYVDTKLHVPAAAGRDAATLRIVTRQGEVEVLEVDPVYRKADVIVLPMQ